MSAPNLCAVVHLGLGISLLLTGSILSSVLWTMWLIQWYSASQGSFPRAGRPALQWVAAAQTSHPPGPCAPGSPPFAPDYSLIPSPNFPVPEGNAKSQQPPDYIISESKPFEQSEFATTPNCPSPTDINVNPGTQNPTKDSRLITRPESEAPASTQPNPVRPARVNDYVDIFRRAVAPPNCFPKVEAFFTVWTPI